MLYLWGGPNVLQDDFAKFRSGQQQLKDPAPTGHPARTTTKGNIEKNQQYPTNRCPIQSEAITLVNKLVVSMNSWYFKEALTTSENKCKMDTPFVDR